MYLQDPVRAFVDTLPAVDIVAPAQTTPRWSIVTRTGFQFAVLYFGIYVVFTQMLYGLLAIPGLSLPRIDQTGLPKRIVEWTAANVFGVTQPLVILSGSGDKTFDWVQAFCFLVLAAVGTVVWSIVARRRTAHPAVFRWFHLFARFALGSTMVSYGAAKAIPLQMPFPPLERLVEPFGHFSPMGVLWYSIGASRPYEIFTGCAEIFAGLLLFIPATRTLGALVALACTMQIFTLNMTYDVPVKLFAFHLILLSLFLLAPEMRRLLNVFVLNRPAPTSAVPSVGRSPRARRIAVAAQVVFGLFLIGVNMQQSVSAWSQYGGGAPKSPLYGVWDVAYMSIDGVERAPLITDYDRFQRVLFDSPARMSFQRMDATFVRHGNTIDMAGKSLKLTKGGDQKWLANFTFQQPAPDRLTLDGMMDGRKIQMRLTLFPREKFLLVSRGFNWLQEFPFNR